MDIMKAAHQATAEKLGWRVSEAAEFLVNLLAGTELSSEKVYQLANAAGIAKTTLCRAKRIVKAKSRRKNHKWYMTVPEEMKVRTFKTSKPSQQGYLLRPVESHTISSDWVSVVPRGDGVGLADIPPRVSPGLRIKVGAYEFEADENFPADKLAELLRGLAVSGQ